ncbi:MAG: hypothetical protein C0497_04170 [Gemmatimonas sp.]|nr:hypothetical protein [Gemmatimonas sp.]
MDLQTPMHLLNIPSPRVRRTRIAAVNAALRKHWADIWRTLRANAPVPPVPTEDDELLAAFFEVSARPDGDLWLDAHMDSGHASAYALAALQVIHRYCVRGVLAFVDGSTMVGYAIDVSARGAETRELVPAPRPAFYVLQIASCIEPIKHGPYPTRQERDAVARRLHDASRGDEDGVFWLDHVYARGGKRLTIKTGAYAGAFFDAAVA